MINENFDIRVAIDVNAMGQQFKGMITQHHEEIQQLVSQAFESAANEITSDMIKVHIKDGIIKAIQSQFSSYKIEAMVEKAISEKLSKLVKAFATNIIDSAADDFFED